VTATAAIASRSNAELADGARDGDVAFPASRTSLASVRSDERKKNPRGQVYNAVENVCVTVGRSKEPCPSGQVE
jgi:hypothetical protein